MSTLRITNIEAKADPSSPTVDEKIKLTNSNGDILVHIDGKTSGITTIGINTTAGNIKFDQNSNVVVTGIITATKFVGTIEPTDLTVSGNVSVGSSVTAATFYGNGANLTGIDATQIQTGNTSVQTVDTGSDGHVKINTEGSERLRIDSSGNLLLKTGEIDIQGGNKTVKTSAGFLQVGTSGSHYLSLITAGLQRLNITSGGLVGINQNTPQTTFHSTGTTNGQQATFGIDNSGLKISTFQKTDNDAGVILDAQQSSNGTLTFATAGTERFRILSDGKVAIGGVTANSLLDVHGGDGISITHSGDTFLQSRTTGTTGTNYLEFKDSGGGAGAISYHHNGNSMRFKVSGSERLRIDSSGRLLVGTTNSTGTQLLKINGDTGGSTYGGHIALTQGTTSPGNGATHGVLSFGTETRPEVVKVVGFVDGTWTDGQYHPSGLYISTTDYNRNSPTEKIRITDIGEINCYSSGACIQAGTLQGGGYNVYFYEGRRNQNTGGTRTYIVWSNGNVENTNNSYGSISDQRLKENIVDATSQWDDIKSLQIRKYNFREATGNETHTQIGLIAQEVESVSPGLVQTTAVSEGDVLQDADGNQMESVKSINYSVLYMKAVKALQEAQTRIEALEARVTTLEG